jgi:hypothetical protein
MAWVSTWFSLSLSLSLSLSVSLSLSLSLSPCVSLDRDQLNEVVVCWIDSRGAALIALDHAAITARLCARVALELADRQVGVVGGVRTVQAL